MKTEALAALAAMCLASPALAEGLAPRGSIEPEQYICYRTAAALTVDGNLDEPSWRAAPWTAYFVDIEGDRRPRPRFATRAKMLWDD